MQAGYKISALEVERVLLGHPGVAEAVVVGVPDDTWGQRVGALVRVVDGEGDKEALTEWMRERLARYKVPSVWEFCESIPKNQMGKVNKKALTPLLQKRH